jgi:hypothetical protein
MNFNGEVLAQGCIDGSVARHLTQTLKFCGYYRELKVTAPSGGANMTRMKMAFIFYMKMVYLKGGP